MKQWQKLMAAEEKRTGLPAGMLSSLVQQETGGQQRFIDKPDDFHYKVGPNGEKPESTARGLGGVLEGTARDPGYGVTPLKDWSVPEQLRFIADYAKARIKQAGSVEGGLAGYGEGAKYAQQVSNRISNRRPNQPQATPVASVQPSVLAIPDEQFQQLPALAQTTEPPVQPLPIVEPPIQVAAVPEEVMPPPAPEQVALNEWNQFQNVMPVQFKPNDMNYVSPLSKPQLSNAKPDFSRFKGWMSKA